MTLWISAEGVEGEGQDGEGEGEQDEGAKGGRTSGEEGVL